MKKLFLTLAIAAAGIFGAQAADEYVRDVNYLPQAAKMFLDQHFAKSDVSVIKIDKDFGRISDYEVVLDDGTEVTFDRNGQWGNVEVPVSKTVPTAVVPNAISGYVAKNYPEQRIVSIDKDRFGIEVQLQSGVELKFGLDGKFKGIDD